MATKTFKSEYHTGGSIKVTTNVNKVTFLICGAERSFDTTLGSQWRDMDFFLFEHTSSYYTDKILDWVKSKIK